MSEVENIYRIVSTVDDPEDAANALYDAGYRFPIPTMDLDEQFIRKATVTGMATLMTWICSEPSASGDINMDAAQALAHSGLYRQEGAAQEYSKVMETETVEEAPVEVDPNNPALMLTLHDRCEQCGAAALSIFEKGDDESWKFCGHHGREYKDKLQSLGYTFWTTEEEWEPLRMPAGV